MKKVYFSFVLLVFSLGAMFAQGQQLPNGNCNDWSGAKFKGEIQPASWHYSNVTQLGIEFNFSHRETGRSGQSGDYAMMVQDQALEVMGIGETSPGYIALGQPWVYLKDLGSISKATAGTHGGISWNSRPDTLSIWVKRTGSHWKDEDFHVLYYAWKGTAKSSKYKGKDGSCTSVAWDDEESDIRIALDGNECGTDTKATQICEGWVRDRQQYNNWVNLRIPIYYMTNDVPEKMNVILSASNYPNFRANSGLYEGNSLYVDDMELIYSASIQQLIIDDVVWSGFNPNTEDVQFYELGRDAVSVPKIEAKRGAGSLTNTKGVTVSFPGRLLSDKEMTVQKGAIGDITRITVTSEDGKSTKTYQIRFVREASANTQLDGIQVNGNPIENFSPKVLTYDYALPFGTIENPIVTCTPHEAEQSVEIMQASSQTGTAYIYVTAANGRNKATYTINFSTEALKDNTLKDILVNGNSIPDYTPTRTSYRISLPVDTKEMPTVKAVSAYPEGMQTIQYTAPSVIDGGVYQISVTTPGNPTAKVYKLTFKLEPSSYAYLKDLRMGEGDENLIEGFEPEKMIYNVSLPLGTMEQPTITPVPGDIYQTVEVQYGGLNGTSRVLVTAGDGVTTSLYKINVSTEASSVTTLKGIFVNGVLIPGFDPQVLSYNYDLPLGTTEMPVVTVEQGDEYQTVTITYGGLNGITRIFVTAGDGSTRSYQIQFHQQVSSVNTLKDIQVDGVSLPGFDPQVLEYTYSLPVGTTTLPEVTYTPGDEYQTIMTRSGGVNGDYKIIVYPQQGASQTYIIHFQVATSSNTDLAMIYVDGQPLEGFDANIKEYNIDLPEGISVIPTVTADKAESSQRVLILLQGSQVLITVTAQSGAKATYTLNFIIHVSENAFLKAIFLDGDTIEGFAPERLNYEVSYTGERPTVTVEPDEGQQVTMVLPQQGGDALIFVQSQAGGINTYTIAFTQILEDDALLTNIFINSEPLAGFQPTTMNYEARYQTQWPEVTWEVEPGLTVTAYQQANNQLLRVASGTKANIYTIAFERDWSNDCELENILIDGEALTSFVATTHEYTIDVAAGSELPQVTFVPKNNQQQLTFGTTLKDASSVTVTAEDGTQSTYTVTFNKALYDLTAPIMIEVADHEINYQPLTLVYNLEIGTGESLPQVTVTPDKGQSIMVYDENNSLQKVQVTAENGAQAVYEIRYTHIKSNNALLANILIDNQSIEGFRADSFNYVDSLAWRTKVLPCVMPKGQLSTQTITTHYCAVDGLMTIDVLAEDEVTQQTYTIAFPVIKSANANLQSIAFTDLNDFTFDPEVTDYAFMLPYGTPAVPQLELYEKAEPEQRVDIESRPLGDTTFVTVTAENGDKKTYRFYFEAKEAEAENKLRLIQYKYTRENAPEEVITKSLMTNEKDFEVALPYGTKTFEVIYEKNYDEQVVFVEQGGTLRPTTINVMANHTDYNDLIYTITPNVSTQNPAVLTGLKVNGVEVDGFDSNRFSYVVNIASSPIVEPQVASFQTGVQVLQQDSKHWQAKVMNDGYSNIYDIWFFYPNDIIPNGEFTDWSNCAVTTSAKKPTGWNTIGDASGPYKVIVTLCTPGEECSQATDGSVYLKTRYVDGCARNLPAFITLGTITGTVNTNNSFAVQGGITFRNTPDKLLVRYKAPTVHTKNHIIYQVTGANGVFAIDESDESKVKDYKVREINLIPLHEQSGVPSAINIIINSYHGYQGGLGTEGFGTIAEMNVDYVRTAYNSTLTALKVNGLDASLEGNAFNVELTDPEQTRIPTLTFTGQVSDQAQLITWSQEDAQGVRTATIRNFAEDGTYTDYTLSVTRPRQSSADLQSLLVNGSEITNFDAATTDYSYTMTTAQLPDITYEPKSNLQTIAMSYADSTMTITVKAENGTQKTYKVKMTRTLSDNTNLIAIDGLTGFDEAIRSYIITADQLPDLNFIKAEDAQTVVMDKGVFTITAQNGTVGTYTIIAQPQSRQTQGIISEFELDGTTPMDFGGTNYTKTAPLPEWVSFTREDYRDSVVMIQSEKQIQWQVIGTQATQTYTLSQPEEDVTNTQLSAILVADTLIAGFNADIKEYILITNEAVDLRAIPVYVQQQVTITRNENVYTIEVTAPNGVNKATYTVTIQPDLSNIAELEMIYIDGQELSGFRADSLNYTVILPSPQAKQQEPQMPAITYRAGYKATVAVEAGSKLGEQTMITVTSEDQTVVRIYNVTVEAEPSHNAQLSAILIQNKPVDHFSPTYAYYSSRVQDADFDVTWAAEDKFVTVSRTDSAYDQNILVKLDTKAQDGTTTGHYEVDVYIEAFAASATLADIALNGQPMSAFLPELNPMLAFSPMNNQYTINLPLGATTLPDVQAVLGQEGQKVTYTRNGLQVQLKVVSKDDAVTNTYTLQYVIPKSSNTLLSNIFVNGEPLADFEPTTYVYTYTLPLGEKNKEPEVVGQQSEATQTVADAVFDGTKAMIEVTAEDLTKAQYVVIFDYQPSTIDTLKAIYQNAALLPGFVATTNEYNFLLPMGERRFPNLDWEMGDDYQVVVMDTVLENTYLLQRRITVTAQDGRQRVYSVNYEIQKSDVDTLQNIFINDRRLETFMGSVEEYSIYVDGDEQPVVTFTAGDEYQNVTVLTLPEVEGVKALDKALIMVEAENGNVRFYTIHFLKKLDSNAHLQMIYVGNKALAGFDPEIFAYLYKIDKNAPLPSVGWVAQTDEQQVNSLTVDDTTSLIVRAEDGTTLTYRIVFQHKLSENANLLTILVDGTPMEDFKENIYQYDLIVGYGQKAPEFVAVEQEDEQTITRFDTLLLVEGDTMYVTRFLVQAENIEFENEYIITVTVDRNNDAYLTSIFLKGTPLEGFDPETIEYAVAFPVGSDSTVFYTAEDVTYLLSDPKATAIVSVTEEQTIYINVTAQDGKSRMTYVITQQILLDDNNYLIDILLDNISMPNFTPELDFYTYYLEEGMTPPTIEAIAQSENAKVSINVKSVGDTSIIACESASKKVRKYYIFFTKSPINDAKTPTSRDVLLKHVPGTTNIVVATIRKNVVFRLYDVKGHCHGEYKLTTVNTNFADIDLDSEDQEHLFNFDNAMGLEIHLIPNQFYLYTFMEDDKRILQSGKLLMH